MINSIFLDNFKQFTSFKMENLKRVNLISGSNNTGKSTILEALFFFYDRAAVDNVFRQLTFRGYHSVEVGKAPVWLPLFNNFDLEKAITIRVTDSGQTFDAKYTHDKNAGGKITSLMTSGGTKQNATTLPSNVEALKGTYKGGPRSMGETYLYAASGNQFSLTYNSLSNIKKQVIFLGSSPRAHATEDANRFGDMVVEGTDLIVLKYIKELEPRVSSLSIATFNGQPAIYCDVGLNRKMPVTMMGEGIGKYLSILISLAAVENSIVCIDELENGIHYSLFPKVMAAIESLAIEKNNQVFITTHNHDLLKGLSKHIEISESENFEYIRLDFDEGKVVPKYYDSELITAAIDSQWEIR